MSCGYGRTGSSCSFTWSTWNSGQCSQPANMIQGGTDCDGTPIYVGRANYNGDLIPAKVMPTKNVAYVPWGGKAVSIECCEVLCGNQCDFQWVCCSNGSVPQNAIKIGQTSKCEPLYCGRVNHSGSQCIGKVHPSHCCLYIPFGCYELSFKSYEILTTK